MLEIYKYSWKEHPILGIRKYFRFRVPYKPKRMSQADTDPKYCSLYVTESHCILEQAKIL